MTWTIVSDLRMRQYDQDKVLDSSSFHNDGKIFGNIVTHPKYLTFQGPDDQLEIYVKDDSLQRFTAVRAEAVIRPSPVTRRTNIVTGWMSFSFFVEHDRRLMGTIYDGQNWIECSSGTTLVPFGQWSRVCFEYDGICVGRVFLNGQQVGANINMPTGMYQPREILTVGHWPRGDARYTFVGEMGHVRVSRRDYEDFWRTAVKNLFCGRVLTTRQAAAMAELFELLNSLDPKTQEVIQNCARARAERMIALLHNLLAGDARAIAAHHRLGLNLRQAWCCRGDVREIRKALLDFFRRQAGPPGSQQRAQFMIALDELRQIGDMCTHEEPPGCRPKLPWQIPPAPPFERARKLLLTAVPELAIFEAELDQIIEMI
jgi:hypothetical protein